MYSAFPLPTKKTLVGVVGVNGNGWMPDGQGFVIYWRGIGSSGIARILWCYP